MSEYNKRRTNIHKQPCIICGLTVLVGDGHYFKNAGTTKEYPYSYDVFHIKNCEEQYDEMISVLASCKSFNL